MLLVAGRNCEINVPYYRNMRIPKLVLEKAQRLKSAVGIIADD